MVDSSDLGKVPGVNVEKLHPNVVAAGWVSFFMDLGSELIYHLLPAFISGSTGLNAGKTMLGLIEGLAEATPAFMKLVAGIWADRISNRKWMIFLGYLISSVIKPFIGLATNAWQVLGLRFGDKVGKGIRSAPRDALIADSVPGSLHGRAFGFQRSMDHLGALGGGLVAWFLLQQLGLSLKTVILISAVPGVLCLLTILWLIREIPNRKIPEPKAESKFAGMEELPRPFWLLFAGLMVCAIANSSDAFLLLRAQEMGVSLATIPLIWSFLHLVKSITCWYGGKLSDRFGPRVVTVGGWLLYSGVYLGFSLMNTPGAAWALFGIYGFFFGFTEGSVKAWIASLVPPERRGTAFGVAGLAEGLMLLPACVLAGWTWDTWGSAVPLTLATVFSACAAVWLWVIVPENTGSSI